MIKRPLQFEEFLSKYDICKESSKISISDCRSILNHFKEANSETFDQICHWTEKINVKKSTLDRLLFLENDSVEKLMSEIKISNNRRKDIIKGCLIRKTRSQRKP